MLACTYSLGTFCAIYIYFDVFLSSPGHLKRWMLPTAPHRAVPGTLQRCRHFTLVVAVAVAVVADGGQGDERGVGEAAEAFHLPEDREHEPGSQRGQGYRLRRDQRERQGEDFRFFIGLAASLRACVCTITVTDGS